jgi:ribA/ribD-fused uncharacterized protein
MDNSSIYNLGSLKTQIKQGFQPTYLFFWGNQGREEGHVGKQCLSQWWNSSFEVEGIVYPTAEHFMMAEKARLFRDETILKKILLASSPREAKELGRYVSNFDESIWLQNRFDIVVRANEAKFTQNEAIRNFLLETKDKILVEASPVDTIWGIGLTEHDPRASNPDQWKGLNLLGFSLMTVRSKLREVL